MFINAVVVSVSVGRTVFEEMSIASGYVQFMETDDECMFTGLVRKPEGKRSLGSSESISDGYIKTGLMEMGWEYVDWICVTQDPMEDTCEHGNERSSYQKKRGGGTYGLADGVLAAQEGPWTWEGQDRKR
jgi:hypothetical protein